MLQQPSGAHGHGELRGLKGNDEDVEADKGWFVKRRGKLSDSRKRTSNQRTNFTKVDVNFPVAPGGL